MTLDEAVAYLNELLATPEGQNEKSLQALVAIANRVKELTP